MVCLECNKHLNDCPCPDIEDRLRYLIANGNAFARREAKRGLMERLASKPMSRERIENFTDEDVEVFEYALARAWAEHAKLN